MIVRFLTKNVSIQIDEASTYEFDGIVTSEQLHMFMKEIHGWGHLILLTFPIYGSTAKFKTALSNHVSQHCPEIYIE